MDAEDSSGARLGVISGEQGGGVRDLCGHLGLLALKVPRDFPPLQPYLGLFPL